MNEALVRPPVARTGSAAMALPAVIVDAGPVAVERFLEFFAASIANGRTRAAYGRAVGQFLSWCSSRGLGLRAIAPLHVAAYIRTHPGSAPTVKQHLAAIRVLCDWLVVHQVLPVNPAAAVRGPKHVVTKGATPVLTPAETRSLLDGIDPGSLVGLRDRALLSVMVYSFARVSAVVGMRRQDYFLQGTRGWLRLHEKGGKRHDVPAHHRAEAAVDAYLVAGGIEDAGNTRAIWHAERFTVSTTSQTVRRIEFCHTPKHGSWLNIAENELSSMTRQCVRGRRIGDLGTLHAGARLSR